MFYFLICQSSMMEYSNTEKKYLTSFFWGTIAYIFSHALFSSSDAPFAIQLKKSFWLILFIDLVALFYMYNYIKDKNSADSDSSFVDDLIKNFSNKIQKDMSELNENINDLSETINKDDSYDDDDYDKIDDVPQKINSDNKHDIEPKVPEKKPNDSIYTSDLIIPANNEHNIDYPETSTQTNKIYSTPIKNLNDNNIKYNDDYRANDIQPSPKSDHINFDVKFEDDDDDDSGSDIDIEQFNDFIK